MRVLVVEDTDVVLQLLRINLTMAGHEVVEVSSKFQELLAPANPLWEGIDVIVCDKMLAGVKGEDILEKAAMFFPRIYRVLVTGAYVSNDPDEALLQYPSANVVLYKPQGVLDIVSVINSLE